MTVPPPAPDQEPPHEIEAIPNSGGGFTHYCHVCGQMGVGLAPELPCPGALAQQVTYDEAVAEGMDPYERAGDE